MEFASRRNCFAVILTAFETSLKGRIAFSRRLRQMSELTANAAGNTAQSGPSRKFR
jgi:hypothetical protein